MGIQWEPDLIKAVEWKTFEKLCAELIRIAGYLPIITPSGKDKGVDIYVYHEKCAKTPIGIAQCKAWNKTKVGVNSIREFFGAMNSIGCKNGLYFTTNDFTGDAVDFAKKNGIKIYNGEKIFKIVKRRGEAFEEFLIRLLEHNNFVYPTCSNCNVKMLLRTSKKTEDHFWGCRNFPMCRIHFPLTEQQRKYLNESETPTKRLSKCG